ncbi:hypothetical protein KJ996_04870 [Patescibacteria group bacterium]|nr:hypothetical protein [Patescibacteria group bacterium]
MRANLAFVGDVMDALVESIGDALGPLRTFDDVDWHVDRLRSDPMLKDVVGHLLVKFPVMSEPIQVVEGVDINMSGRVPEDWQVPDAFSPSDWDEGHTEASKKTMARCRVKFGASCHRIREAVESNGWHCASFWDLLSYKKAGYARARFSRYQALKTKGAKRICSLKGKVLGTPLANMAVISQGSFVVVWKDAA